MSDAARRCLTAAAVLLGTCATVHSAQSTRPARADEVGELCAAIDRMQAAESLDQGLDMAACRRVAMTVARHEDRLQISGTVPINFPAYTMDASCRAVIRAGHVDPASLDCR